MKINREGCTRVVLLTKRYAIKIPNFAAYRLFLHGLIANMQERQFSKAGWPELCPVLFALPMGLLVVMPRADIFTDEEFLAFDIDAFREKEDYVVPVESKANSFGWLHGRPVAVDYG